MITVTEFINGYVVEWDSQILKVFLSKEFPQDRVRQALDATGTAGLRFLTVDVEVNTQGMQIATPGGLPMFPISLASVLPAKLKRPWLVPPVETNRPYYRKGRW